MHRYDEKSLNTDKTVNNILKKYPDLLTTINTNNKNSLSKFKCEGRILRRDTERIKKMKRFRKQSVCQRLKQFESVFFDQMDNLMCLFNCPICRNVLKTPITVECGHTFCDDCLDFNKCAVCDADVLVAGDEKKCVNVLVQDIVEKWRERNRLQEKSDFLVPDTVDILGVEPRYHLRSGFSGLQLKDYIDPNINCIDEITNNPFKTKKESSNNLRNNDWNSNCLFSDDLLPNPTHFQQTLDTIFKEVNGIKEEALKDSWNNILQLGDVECILCSRCILDPVTTGCGHTFCRGCLTRVLDHGLSCPLCMRSLNILDYYRGTTIALQEAIQFLLPVDYNERMSISLKESLILEKDSDIPVFVCTNTFPGVACPLHVYEPRYKLLTRRCLQSPTKRFAMAGKESNGNSFVSYGTILELKDAVHLQDGRFILTTVGVRRFKVISKQEQDGYDTAKIQYIKDSIVSADKLPELILLHDKVHDKAYKWIRSFKPKVLAEVERLIGKMPKVEKKWMNLPDGPSWTWWLMPILPLSSQLQVGFLSTTSLEKRLRAIDKMLDHMKIRMRALERNTVSCPHNEDVMDTCAISERAFDVPFNNS